MTTMNPRTHESTSECRKARIYRLTAAVAFPVFLLSGCASNPEGNKAAAAGIASGIGTTIFRLAQGDDLEDAVAKGAAVGLAVAVTVYVVEKRRASKRQIQLAQTRARNYERTHPRKPPRGSGSGQSSTSSARPQSRYIAVETERDSQSKGKGSVMIWDTKHNSLVSNDVYDVDSVPRKGQLAKFEEYEAVYVADGK